MMPGATPTRLTAAELSAIAGRLYRPRGEDRARVVGRTGAGAELEEGGGEVSWWLGWLNEHRPWICPFEELLEHLPRKVGASDAGATVLDVGCGGGLLLGLAAMTGRLGLGVGFDASARAISVARVMARRVERALGSGGGWAGGAGVPRLMVSCVDVGEAWPGPGSGRAADASVPAEFDAVTVVDVLHHIPTSDGQRGVIAESARRLKPGGLLIYKDMCRRPRWRAAANRLHDLVLARQWIRYVAIETVQSWGESVGLRVERRADFTRYWYGHELLVMRKGGG